MADETCVTFPDQEEWRACADFPDYEVSGWGRVRRRRIGSKILKASPDPNSGYRVISIYNGGIKSCVKVHFLVCAAFYGPKPSATHEVAHHDGNKTNCRWDNLRWATHLENMQDMVLHGRAKQKLTAEKVLLIRRRIATGETLAKIAADFGVTATMISRIKHRRKGTWNWVPQEVTTNPARP